MKNYLFILLFLVLVIESPAQDYQISFAGTGASTVVGTVKVENLTQGKSTTLSGSDVLHLVATSTGLNPMPEFEKTLRIYPNPMAGTCTIEFAATASGRTNLELFDITGKRVVSTLNTLAIGTHSFMVSGLSSGIYTLRIYSQAYTYTGKLVSNSTIHSGVKMNYLGSSSIAGTAKKLKSASAEKIMQYTSGDRLKYTGSSGKYGTIVTDVPTQSKTITFTFVTCTDADGNNYPVVQIGTQIWMAENLRTTKYHNGDPIALITNTGDWASAITGAYCNYDNNTANVEDYGRLYNWYAVKDSRSIAPEGWNVPSYDESVAMAKSLVGDKAAGGKLKETSTMHWYSPNTGADNSTGFTGKPGGVRLTDGIFYSKGYYAYWWCPSVSETISSHAFGLSYNRDSLKNYIGEKKYGLSVRCVKDSETTELTSIVIGKTIEVASSTIPISGGIIKVSKPDTPVDGMEITIPANSFSSGRTFKISYSEIKSHDFGQYFNPITPMIQIENGDGYANGIMEITIPVIIPKGDIPIGFYYDEMTGKLEGIPFKSISSNSITLLTRHFSSGSYLRNNGESLKSVNIETNAGAKIIVISISESILKSKPIISSGYKPGIDDWEFVNNGSFIAPGGQCAGQDMTSMWYYFEKKESEGNLFNKFSTVPTLEQDNAIGYRFCSVIQQDLVSSGAVNSFFWAYIDRNQELDQLKFFTMAGAMLITGEPQGIAIYMEKGKNADGFPLYDAHDLICYQFSMTEGLLYISDPNTPGKEQTIEFINDKFEPYIAKNNGNAASFPFPYITWYAKTAYIEWPQIGKRYNELRDSTIGNNEPNTFPGYTIWVKGKVDTKLTNGFSSDLDTLRCMVECPTTTRGWLIDGKKFIMFDMYDVNGNKINVSEGRGKGYTILQPGLNKIGFYISSEKAGVLDKDQKNYPLFIDFKWFNIYYSKLKISPNPIASEPEKDVKITAMSYKSAPKDAKYVWNFGDGSSEVTVKNDSIVQHKFSKEGNYDVSVKLYDNSTNKLVGQATAKANIGTDNITDIDGNVYHLVTIGTQVWLVENLKATHYSNGDQIPNIIKDNEWFQTKTGAWCDYNNDGNNGITYGRLYNWRAVSDSRNICPSGWHVPSDAEWTALDDFLLWHVGGKLKEAGTAHWASPNTGATNESGFTALPGGDRMYEGTYVGMGNYGQYWSSTVGPDPNNAYCRQLLYDNDFMFRNVPSFIEDGFSVRCLKD